MGVSHRIGQVRIREYGNGEWIVDVRAQHSLTGKRQRKSFPSRRAAEAEARLLNDAIAYRRVQPYRHEPQSIAFADLLGQWRLSEELRVSAGKKRGSSLETDLHRAKPLSDFFGTMLAGQIGDDDISRYQVRRLNVRGRKPNTVNGEVRTLRKILRWAHRKGLVARLPAFEMVPVKLKAVAPLSEGEMVALVKALPPRLRLLAGFMLETGCRPGEAFNLTWDCIDQETGAVEIRSREGWMTKTDHSERTLYVSGELLAAIQRVPRQGVYVFPGRVPGQPIGNIRKALAAASRKAGIVRGGKPFAVKAHMLRKSRATQLAMDASVAMRTLQKQLGHSPGSSVTFRHYADATDTALRALAKPVAGLDWASLPVQRGKKGQREIAVVRIVGRDAESEVSK